MDGMLGFFKEGGSPMFFLMGIGLVTLGTAFWFAVRPSAVHTGFLKWMCAALVFGSAASVLVDFAEVFHAAAGVADATTRVRIVLQGSAEACTPGILGAAFLALVAMLCAVGQRRLDARKS
jgi:hypothetical protein